MSLKIRDKDKGWKKHGHMLKRQSMRRPHVLVGVQGKYGTYIRPDSELTNVTIGAIHEFGYGVPERSFIRATHDNNLKNYRKYMRILAEKVIVGKLNFRQALGIFGEIVVSNIRAYMRAGIDPLKADGSICRLIDTSQLISSLTYVVKNI